MFKKNTPLKVVLVIFITEIIILIGLGIALQTNIIGFVSFNPKSCIILCLSFIL